jgi:FHS family glucose/mannose:H+ symporter-like MFS transporter
VSTVPASAIAASERRSGSGTDLAGFLLSGFLLALLGALLPAWGYHRDPPEFSVVGNFFLSLAVGIVASGTAGRAIVRRRGVSFLLAAGCSASCAALAVLAASGPPASAWWRASGLLALGFGAGLLNMGLFHSVSHGYGADPAGTVTRGGVWYGLGCLTATLLVADAFYLFADPNVAVLLAVMASLPGAFALFYFRKSYPVLRAGTERTLRQAMADFRSPGAVFFALLLFFQFGNEWSIAGWLPMFLMRRVGLSPKAGLFILSLYWLFLLAGRLGAAAILPRVRHGRLLAASVLSALFGCLILFSTKTGFGAASGVFFLGAGYASVYPLVAEAIGRRFPYYHPGFFNGIFSVALLGGLLAPATLGYAADAWGVGVVVGIPLLGSCMVGLLVLAIWLESKVMGQ